MSAYDDDDYINDG